MIKTEWEVRRDIVFTGKRVYEKGLVSATDGNISVRMMPDRLMITPAGSCLGSLNVNDLVYVDLQGQILQANIKPSSELPMHLEIYRQRPDINAIIHAHPGKTIAFTVAGKDLSRPVLPEVVVMFGKIPVAHYATPSTSESAEVIKDYVKDHEVIVLDHHGAVSLGKSLEDAYHKMEKLEHTANVLFTASQLGEVKELGQQDLDKLLQLKQYVTDKA